MIHAQNVFYYDIESRLEERLECRFQETTESGDTVTVRKSDFIAGISKFT